MKEAGETDMDHKKQDTLMFFDKHPAAYPLYECFETNLLERFPQTITRVQKTQISFYNRHLYACVSFQRVRKKADLPDPYIVITMGLPYPLESSRVAAKTEPYPGRWTTHVVVGSVEEIDEELLSWVQQAYSFSENK